MLRNIKKFVNVNFKIEECEDNVYSSDEESDNEEKEENKEDMSQSEDE